MGDKQPSNRLDRRAYMKAAGGAITMATFAGCSTSLDDDSGGTDGSTATPMGDSVQMGDFSVPSENILAEGDIQNTEKRRIGQMPLFAKPQGNDPNQYEAAQIFAENMAKLGVEVPIQTMTQNTIFDKAYIRREPDGNNWWYWSMWDFSPRVTRLDPDELLFNHHSRRQTGYNWMYWENEEFDSLVEEQRRLVDPAERQEVVYECQRVIHEEGPDNMLLFPEVALPYNSEKWEGITNIKGLGPANMLTMANATPKTDDTEFVATDTSGTTFKALTPWGFGNEFDIRQSRMIYDRLLWPTPDGTGFQNRLATNVEYEDETTAVIDIREGHNWHDGSEVLAEDVKFSYDVNNPDSDYGYTTNYGGSLDPVASIEVDDDYRLTINLDYAFAPLKLALFVRVPIAQKKRWEEIFQSSHFKNRGTDIGHYNAQSDRVGSGPMKFDQWDKDEGSVRLTKYANHFDPINYDARITVGTPGAQQALGKLKSGEADMITQYSGDPAALYKFVDENDNLSLGTTNSCVGEWISINCDHQPNNIAEFRRASFHCWDEEEILNTIYNGRGETGAKHYISPVLGDWFNDDLDPYPADLQAAANELASAGFVWSEENGELYMPEDRYCLTQEEVKHATEHGDRFNRDLVTCE